MRMLHFACKCPARAATLAVTVAVVLLAAAPATAALYKWVDANGRVTYSDQPPPSNVKAETVTAPAAAANPEAVKEMASQEVELKKRQAQRADEQKKAAQARVDEANRRQFCVDARGQIRMYESDVLLRRVNEQGEPVYLDDSMKRKEKEHLEAIVRDQCGVAPAPRAAAQ
jgi:Domain of unknown function (DUF4124)